jgi:hypothetical protein
MKFRIIFKRGINTVAQVVGGEISKDLLSMADLERVIETEQYLERLTGLRVHIEEQHEGK